MVVSVGQGAPAEGPQLVARRVGAIFGRRLLAGGKRSLEEITTTSPHRAFRCGLIEAREDVLAAAEFVGWRYLVLHREQALVSATVGPDETETRWEVIYISRSRALEPDIADLEWLALQPEVTDGDFEICYLRIAAGIGRAWWLRTSSDNRDGDLLAPLRPSHPDLRRRKRRLISAAEFREVVAKIARERPIDPVPWRRDRRVPKPR